MIENLQGKSQTSKLQNFFIGLVAIFAVNIGVSLATSTFQEDNITGFILNSLIFNLAFIFLMLFLFRKNLKFNKDWFKISSYWAFCLGLAIVSFFFINSYLYGKTEIFGQIYNFKLEANLNFEPSQIGFFGIVIGLLLIQTLAEEWVFRGWLFSSLNNLLGGKWSIFITSILFGLIHIPGNNFPISGFLSTFGLSVLWCLLTNWTGSFLNAWPIHFLNNFFFIFVLGYNQFSLSEYSLFRMENLPNNLVWSAIYFLINVIWILYARKMVKLNLVKISS